MPSLKNCVDCDRPIDPENGPFCENCEKRSERSNRSDRQEQEGEGSC